MVEMRPTRPTPPTKPAETVRDENSTRSQRATTRDRATTETGGLPPPVLDEYEPVKSLRAGGEAHVVMLARHRETGVLRVIKVYGTAIRPDPQLLAALKAGDPRHVVQIIDWGEHTDRYGSSVSWEVMEHIEHGSLREMVAAHDGSLPDADIREVVEELTDALHYLHTQVNHGNSVGFAHRDVKPENVLVRTVRPLDLVLCDFGLVAEIRATRMTSRRAGTAEYQAPETWLQASRDPSQDWWSLGMIVLELVLGKNPNVVDSGRSFSDKELFDHLIQEGVALDEVTDPRWHLLCSGLLTFTQVYRWGAQQVREWLKNLTPPVHFGRFEPPLAARPAPPFEIAGVPCADAVAVATALNDNWRAAIRLFRSREQRLALSDWLDDNFPDMNLPTDLFRRDPSNDTEAGLRSARFVAWTAPHLRPNYLGHVADAAGIARLVAAAANNPAVATVVDGIEATHLRVFAKHACGVHPSCHGGPGCQVLGRAATMIDSARRSLEQRLLALADTLRSRPLTPLGPDEVLQAHLTLIRALVDPAFAAGLLATVRAPHEADAIRWWCDAAEVARGDGSADQVAALVLVNATTGRALVALADIRGKEERRRVEQREQNRERRRLARVAAIERFRPLGLELVALSLAMAAVYLATMAAVVSLALLASEGSPVDPTQVSNIATLMQVEIAFPVTILLGCVLIRPRSPTAGITAYWVVAAAMVAVWLAVASQHPGVLAFPVRWQSGVVQWCLQANTMITGNGQVTPAVLVIALIGAAVLARMMLGVTRRYRRNGGPSQGSVFVKRALVTFVLAVLAMRFAHEVLAWPVPGWLPSPMTTWLTI